MSNTNLLKVQNLLDRYLAGDLRLPDQYEVIAILQMLLDAHKRIAELENRPPNADKILK